MTRVERVTRAALLTQQAIDMVGRHWLDADAPVGADIRGAHGALQAALRLFAAAMAREEVPPEQD